MIYHLPHTHCGISRARRLRLYQQSWKQRPPFER